MTLAIKNLDEVAPVFSSAVAATATVRTGGAPQLVYTASAVDVVDDGVGQVRYSLKPGSDPALHIDEVTGELLLTGQPSRQPYIFTLIATDAIGNSSEQRCELRIKMAGAGSQAYDAVRQVEVIREDTGSIKFVLQGDRVMLDASQLALVAQKLALAEPVLVTMPDTSSGTELRQQIASVLPAPVSATSVLPTIARESVVARLGESDAKQSPEQSSSAQILATPEIRVERTVTTEPRTKSEPSIPAPIPIPLELPAETIDNISVQKVPNEPTEPAAAPNPVNANELPATPEVNSEPPEVDVDSEAFKSIPIAGRFKSMLADLYARLKSLAVDSAPASVPPSAPESAVQTLNVQASKKVSAETETTTTTDA